MPDLANVFLSTDFEPKPLNLATKGPDSLIRRAKSFPTCGRLIAMPTTSSLDINLDNEVSIDFPAMPDSIELNRSANYTVHPNFFLPDGIHQYKHTEPLQIQISFRLHAFDQEFCPKGALTLLEVAARLHSFILPIHSGPGAVDISAQMPPAEGATADTTTHMDSSEQRSAQAEGRPEVMEQGASNISAPVTCRLEVLLVDKESFAIAATGYLKEVSAKLQGPWLRGPGSAFNLPSAGDFSFTFVHRPGHGNSFNFKSTEAGSTLGQQPQAYAHTVKNKFYNTRSLAVANYAGFDKK